jgi:SprT protein
MYVPQAIKDRCEQSLRRFIGIAEARFGRAYTVPVIEYTDRGKRAGYAQGENLINLNPVLLMENVEEFVNQVVPHELAHCIDTANGGNRRVFGMKRSIHGPSWKAIMRLFGCDALRCHSMDTSNAQVRTKTKYEYRCECCSKTYILSSVRHNRQQQWNQVNPGKSFYFCKTCGPTGTLTLMANHGKVSVVEARKLAANNPMQKEVTVSSFNLPSGAL